MEDTWIDSARMFIRDSECDCDCYLCANGEHCDRLYCESLEEELFPVDDSFSEQSRELIYGRKN